MPRTTICLCMLVKNEAHNINTALESVYSYIDHAVILDTGSTDGTQAMITAYLQARNIPFDLIQDNDWKGFGVMRSKLLELSWKKCDYRLILDGDNIFKREHGEMIKNLTAEAYYITKMHGTTEVPLLMLFRSDKHWEYVGVVHEFPTLRERHIAQLATLPDTYIIELDKAEGRPGRTPEHYLNDAKTIEREIFNQDMPQYLRHRYQFYLAQSYKDAGEIQKAVRAYKERIDMDGWVEEVYISMLTVARLIKAKPCFDMWYMNGWLFRAVNLMPHRLEAAYELMAILNEQQQFHISRAIGGLVEVAHEHNTEPIMLLVERDIYQWKFFDVYSVAAYYAGKYALAINLFEKINLADVPIDQLARLKENETFFRSKR